MWQDLTEQAKTSWTVLNDGMEIDGMEQGVARYRRERDHVEVGRPEKKVMTKAIEGLSALIKQDQDEFTSGKARMGRPMSWVSSYISMDPDKLALISMTCMLATEDNQLTKVALAIANRVKLEHEFDEIRDMNRKRGKEDKGFTRNFSDRLTDQRKVRELYKRLCDEPLRWSFTQRLGLGARLIQKTIAATGLWNIERRREANKTVMWLVVTDALAEMVARGHSDIEILRPVMMPMSCPPLPWICEDGKIVGGYRLIKTQLVRDRFGEHPSDYSGAGMDAVLEALNAIQAVEWRIDERIYRLALHLYNINSKEYGNAVSFLPAKPEVPPFDKAFTKAERKLWRQSKESARTSWSAAASIRTAQLRALRTAGMFVSPTSSGIPVFFPHNLDWRGRIYPLPSYLSPQGFDLQKAMLKYSKHLPIGANGLRNLKIWAAGCAGVDKVSFDDRVRWFDDNWEPATFDPLVDKRWVEYDSPFLFVQAILEIQDVIKSGLGSAFRSGLSVCVDGSQNGLQHLSAIGRDERGGAATNLVDAEVPEDLYSDVASIVFEAVCHDHELAKSSGQTEDELGNSLPPLVWKDALTLPKRRRSVVKRSVLAYPYGVTKAGMRDGLIVDGFVDGLSGSKHRNAWYLAEKIDLAVRDVVISAATIMDWFRTVADKSAKAGKTLKWVAPSGFPVNMHYFVKTSREIRTCLARLSIREPANKNDIDNSAQIRGIVANFIHSLDASHLVGTVHRCMEHDIEDFQFVHDSYGTHVCNIDLLGRLLREEFVEMHEFNPLESFIKNLEIEHDPPPPMGSLDLKSVLDSRFFFA